MIIHNGDKFCPQLTDACNKMFDPKSCKDFTEMMIYGVTQKKNTDLVIHESFKDSAKLLAFIKKKNSGLIIHTGEYGSMDYPQSRRIGLGYNLRNNHPDLCHKIITACYLALNKKLDYNEG